MQLKPWPSTTLAVYQMRTFAIRIVAFAFVLIGLLQVLDLLSESEKILRVPGNGNPELLLYLKLRLPQLVDTFLPFSVLLGALVTWSGFANSSEITIMRGAGLSPHAILMPMTLLALVVSGLHFLFAETILPDTNRQLDAWQKADYEAIDFSAPDRRFDVWESGAEDILHADRVEGDGDSTRLYGVEVYRLRDDILVSQVRADSARPVGDGWRLSDSQAFDVDDAEVEDVAGLTVGRGIEPQAFTVITPDPDEVTTAELRTAIGRLEEAGRSTEGLRTDLYQKYVKPLSAILMPLLGAVAGFGLARSGQLFIRSVIGLALGFAYFVADNAMLAMGQFGAAPPLLAAWGPFLLFLIVGEALIFRTEE